MMSAEVAFEKAKRILEKMQGLKPVLPADAFAQLEKGIEDRNINAISLSVDKINSAVNAYQANVNNPNLNEGEQQLWSHKIQKGLFQKETVEEWGISDFRAWKDMHGQRHAVGLAIASTVVMNQHQNSSGTRIGTFSGIRGGYFAGSSMSLSTSKSHTVGDLVFFVGGHEVLRFSGISDPHGVRKMIELVKKQQIKGY